MYRWMGSAMSPRPSYVSAAPFIATRVPRSARRGAVERVAVHRTHGDDTLGFATAYGHVDGVAGAPPPQPLVEFFLGRDTHAIHADDAIAAPESRRPRGAGVVEPVDH